NSAILSGFLIPPPLYYFIAIAITIGTRFFLEINISSHSALWTAGILLLAGSIALALWTKYVMTRKGTTANSYKQSMVVVTNGPFRFSRNPMYLSINLLTIGLSFVFNDLILLILTGFAVLIIHVVIKREERYLAKKFGEEYLRYKKRVRRWI
ncbi:MAG: isoprenylcysteine carboxylmethyltransferase family protein, partial [Flavobacteriales bacterium]|nr:isoprenylcysteine carboxylmethyltransferase family protein [Flavobacteriales bacterium]